MDSIGNGKTWLNCRSKLSHGNRFPTKCTQSNKTKDGIYGMLGVFHEKRRQSNTPLQEKEINILQKIARNYDFFFSFTIFLNNLLLH